MSTASDPSIRYLSKAAGQALWQDLLTKNKIPSTSVTARCIFDETLSSRGKQCQFGLLPLWDNVLRKNFRGEVLHSEFMDLAQRLLSMNRAQTLLQIKEEQRRWADARKVERERDSVMVLENNLYQPLTPETRAQYERGDGDELGKDGKRGKLFPLRSSSALVCNVFDYWRGRVLVPVLNALQISEEANELVFEQKFKTGLRGKSPNLDVVFRRKDTSRHITAIESKFTEPYDEQEHNGFASSYFERRGLWDGLPLCRGLADLIDSGEQFTCLNAAQLLKHILGLYRNHKQCGFTLLYLWYDVRGSDAAETHRKEIEKFRQIVSCEVSFRSMTHQELFAGLLPHIRGTDYAEYLRSRYFPC